MGQLAVIIVSVLATLGSPVLLAGCSSAPSSVGGQEVAAPVLEPPLPPGNWQTIHSGRQEMPRGWSDRAILVSREGDVIDRVVLVYRIHLGKRWEFTPRDACHNVEYFAQHGHAAADRGACRHVRAVNLGTAGQPHWVNIALSSHAEAQDVYLPATMVGVRYIHYQEGELLQVDYLWNADLLLPPPDGRVWLPGDWSNAAVAGDASKQAVMRTLQRWAEEWQPRIDAVMPIAKH